jgi:hypothetical protein
MMAEKLKITIDKKGFELYCKELQKSVKGKKILAKWIKEGIIEVV